MINTGINLLRQSGRVANPPQIERCLNLRGFADLKVAHRVLLALIIIHSAGCRDAPEKDSAVPSAKHHDNPQSLEQAENDIALKQREKVLTAYQSYKIQRLQKQLAEWQNNKNGPLVVTLDEVLLKKGDMEYKRYIETVATFLKQHPELKVSIEGHTDKNSSRQYTLGLSKRHATTVQFALMKHGISSKRIIVKGFGDTRPIDSNHTEAGRKKNRRVEVVIF
jgi:outer membrane protein OmpA-like peptidoglycan-associated protein